MKENRRSNARTFDQGLLVSVQKSIINDTKRNSSSKEDFAAEIGMTEGTLKNKWTFSCKTNDFTIHELIQIMELTGDLTPLEYICHMFDLAVSYTNIEISTNVEELNHLADEAQMESNEAFAEIKKSSKDSKYSNDEILSMRKETLEAIEALHRELNVINKLIPDDLED